MWSKSHVLSCRADTWFIMERYCADCLEKIHRINVLEQEIASLKAKLKYRERKAAQGPFGSSTPSSKVPHKSNSDSEKQKRQGGAQPGHEGNGARKMTRDEADSVVDHPAPETCPECGGKTHAKGQRDRGLYDLEHVEVKIVVHGIERRWCPTCRTVVESPFDEALPASQLSNNLLAHIIGQHYEHHVPLSRICDQLGLHIGTVTGALHKAADLFQPAVKQLEQDFLAAPVKHADETTWRSNGNSGYAWLFATPDTALFKFRNTRSGSVVENLFGKMEEVPGVLVVDRYGGYNNAGLPRQFCQAHLLRTIRELRIEFPANEEIEAFVSTVETLLAEAMGLRSTDISDAEYLQQAAAIRDKIIAAMEADARHPGILNIQAIYRENADKMYHWADNRAIPPDNNFAERTLRGLVTARKVSFGSQSGKGAHTREVLTSIVETCKLRGLAAVQTIAKALKHLSRSPQAKPYPLLFPNHDPTSH